MMRGDSLSVGRVGRGGVCFFGSGALADLLGAGWRLVAISGAALLFAGRGVCGILALPGSLAAGLRVAGRWRPCPCGGDVSEGGG